MRWHFAEFCLDTDRRELRRRGEAVRIEPQAFDLLDYLVTHRDRLVTRDDLIEGVWGGRIVSESALATCINAARAAIGDSGERQALIRTIPRKGLRFVGEVRGEDAATARPGRPTARRRRRPTGPSIAVLPFDNLGGDPEQDYFADGIVEDIITASVAPRWLFVIARNSSFTYKGRAVDVRAGRARARRPLRARGQRAARRRPRAHHGAAHRRRDRRASLGGALRPRSRGRLRAAGRRRAERGRRDRAAAGARGDRSARGASRPRASTPTTCSLRGAGRAPAMDARGRDARRCALQPPRSRSTDGFAIGACGLAPHAATTSAPRTAGWRTARRDRRGDCASARARSSSAATMPRSLARAARRWRRSRPGFEAAGDLIAQSLAHRPQPGLRLAGRGAG